MNNDILKKLRIVELEILDEVVRICKKHKIPYFLVGGTLLGAVRHKGFIPWDDDIDIGMVRDDYEKFLKLVESELNDRFEFQHWKNDKNYYLNFIKIRKKNTLFEEKKMQGINTSKGIFIDIFPYDNLKFGNIEYYKKRSRLFNVLRPIILGKMGIIKKEDLPSKFWFNCFRFFPNRLLLKIQNKVIQKDNNKKTDYLVSFSGAYYAKEVVSKEMLYPLSTIEFEKTKYSSPNNPDAWLKQVYGDYMKLPPKEKRVSHLPQKIIFDTKKGE